MPSGSADGVNKQFLFQKAAMRLEMFNGDAFINQAQLRKSVLEADDATLVKRLFQEPDIAASIEMRAGEGAAPQPIEGQMLQQHLAQHVMQLKEKDPKAGSAIEKDLNAFFEQAAQAANEQATESNGEAIPTEMANAPGVQSEQRIPQPPGMV